jgi:hypothetical protein
MASLPLLALTLFSIAFGVEEAIIVIYLRSLAAHGGEIVKLAVVSPVIPANAYALEIGREACTIVVLGAIAWIAASTLDRRVRAFLFAFGVWDIVYYLGLWVMSGSPALTGYDVLFLIPFPWVAPVWAVMSFAAALVLFGIFGIARKRIPFLIAGLALGWLSFVYPPFARGYPVWLFTLAIVCVALALPLAVRCPGLHTIDGL